ncbi:hypothetical protein CERSUDRAFT_117114 [Gelatoporia subvermispora B]|uniref:L-ornithine N(5)-oxygenase n=1 Tax=Ceriporiopsis subvermispora (strain B) TaxID=914234 RepID=M2QPW0_CERS8|nr:hypothetical protein CERSUDRAFT_117114 [Gelatoporia subvermispora B]
MTSWKESEKGSTSRPRVAIIGAGVGGLTFAIGLKTKLGFEDFTIYEAGADVGGTWRDNTYPGCCSDVPTHLYSLSTGLNPLWSRTHVPQAEIQVYWQALAREYGLYERTRFRTRVVSALWDVRKAVWVIELEGAGEKGQRGEAARRWTEEANVLISAVGLLRDPVFPADIPGRERFGGALFHSARWDHSVELEGKRVAVIGNGCSGAQIVPDIVKIPGIEVVNFCRTPSWIIPMNRFEYKAWHKWVFAHVPLAMRAYRWYLMGMLELWWPLFVGQTNRLRGRTENLVREFMKSVAPEKYHEQLMPKYPMGCKRLVIDTGYLTAMRRPNLTLTWDGVAEVTEKGITTKKGELVPLDVIVFSTGYEADGFPIPVRGKSGLTVQEFFNANGGPTAYHAMSIPGFPNFYLLGGPNSGTSAGSIIYFEECQTNYILQLVAPVIQGSARAFTVTPRACEANNARIQARLKGTVYAGCRSWYRAAGGEGKNFSIWPGMLTSYWWTTRRVVWADYEVEGGERWKRQRKLRTMVKWGGLAVLLASAVCGWMHPEEAQDTLWTLHSQCSALWHSTRDLIAQCVGGI